MSRPRKKDSHLPPCVHLKHGAYYYLKRNVWTPLGADLGGALEKYAAIVQGPAAGGMPKLVDEAMPVICKGLAKSTAAQYKIAGAKLKKALAAFEPERVMPKHLAAIKRAMADRPNMANRVLSVARLIFSYALEEQLVSVNPAIGIKRHKEAKRERLPSLVEYVAVYGKAGPRLQVIMELLRYGGQRTVDTLGIRESDVLEEGIRFRQQKTGAFITVKWSLGLRSAVARARELQGPVRTLTILSNKRRKAPDYRSVKLQWDKACKTAGVEDLHLHDLRAFAATQARREGKNARNLMGHSSEQQTQTYLRDKEPQLVEGPEF